MAAACGAMLRSSMCQLSSTIAGETTAKTTADDHDACCLVCQHTGPTAGMLRWLMNVLRQPPTTTPTHTAIDARRTNTQCSVTVHNRTTPTCPSPILLLATDPFYSLTAVLPRPAAAACAPCSLCWVAWVRGTAAAGRAPMLSTARSLSARQPLGRCACGRV